MGTDIKSAVCSRIAYFLLGCAFAAIVCAAVVVIAFPRKPADTVTVIVNRNNTDTNNPEPGNTSAYGKYRRAAVASDAAPCSKIGMDVLIGAHGSAVDAAVATILCVGVMNSHSNGIGGGHFMTIYEYPRNSKVRNTTTILARERAPIAATERMYVNLTDGSTVGGLAVGVPGEIKGLHEAWLRYGRVDWADLIRPTISMCRDGHIVNPALAQALVAEESYVRKDPELSAVFLNPDGSLKKEGEIVKRPKLANTLIQIANDPNSFYNRNSQLAKDIVQDIQDLGGIITLDDLEQYYIYEEEPVTSHFRNGDVTMISPPPPSSGAVLQYILNILDGYNISSQDYASVERRHLTYQRITEAMKFAYAKRSLLGDKHFVPNLDPIIANLTSSEFADMIRRQINETYTQTLKQYGPAFEVVVDSGTSHLSILTPEGSALAMTSTINTLLGSRVGGSRTGIIFNNEMDDFSTPGTINYYGVPASPTNFIVPHKMPMSSMSPSIIFNNKPPGEVRFICGASGGTRIITSTAFVTINALWFDLPLDVATDLPRFHHQLLPNSIMWENGLDESLKRYLQSRGHQFDATSSSGLAVVQSIRSNCTSWTDENCLVQAVSDKRKQKAGAPYGY